VWFVIKSTTISDLNMVDFDLQPVCGLLLNQFITDADMADFDSQPVRGLVSNLFTPFLTLAWLI